MLTKRKIYVTLDLEHIQNSPVFGNITDELIAEHVAELFSILLVDIDIHPEEGDFFKVSNPVVTLEYPELLSVENPQEEIASE